jgi:hypothetical protein
MHSLRFLSLRSFIQGIRPGSRHFIFYGEELLAPRPIPKLEDHFLSAVRDCLPKLDGFSSIRNLRTRRAVVTRDPPNMGVTITRIKTRGFIPQANYTDRATAACL